MNTRIHWEVTEPGGGQIAAGYAVPQRHEDAEEAVQRSAERKLSRLAGYRVKFHHINWEYRRSLGRGPIVDARPCTGGGYAVWQNDAAIYMDSQL